MDAARVQHYADISYRQKEGLQEKEIGGLPPDEYEELKKMEDEGDEYVPTPKEEEEDSEYLEFHHEDIDMSEEIWLDGGGELKKKPVSHDEFFKT